MASLRGGVGGGLGKGGADGVNDRKAALVTVAVLAGEWVFVGRPLFFKGGNAGGPGAGTGGGALVRPSMCG